MDSPLDTGSLTVLVVLFAVLGLIYGVVLIVSGFRSLRIRNLSEDLPTSTVRSMALGPVELKGVIDAGLEVADPVYRLPCVYYSVSVLHRVLTYEDNSLTFKWVSIFDENSTQRPFWLKDETGTTLVWAPEANLRVGGVYEFTCGFFGSLLGKSAPLEYLRKVKKQRIFCRKVRLYILALRPGRFLYVLGYATARDNFKPTDTRFPEALQQARTLDRGRIIIRHDGEFIIADSEREVTAAQSGVFARFAVGFGLAATSVAAFYFYLQILPGL